MTTHTLLPEQEFRFEVDFGQKATLKLDTGAAEIFGAELALNRAYVFSGQKLAMFSWQGCTFTYIDGDFSSQYIAEETPMVTFYNLHLALEQQRELAKTTNEQGPRVLIAGSPDVGKTSLCKVLLNYAVRQDHNPCCSPIYVNLDPAESDISVPGSLSALPVTDIIDPVLGFLPLYSGHEATSSPLSVYYGYTAMVENVVLYKKLTSTLARVVNQRMENLPSSSWSGLVVDTGGGSSDIGSSAEVIFHAILAFNITVIVIMGNERLYSDIQRMMTPRNVSILKFTKTGGAVQKDLAYVRKLQMGQVHRYFYGVPSTLSELSPCLIRVKFDNILIYKIGEVTLAPSSALPIGADRRVTETNLMEIKPSDAILHSVLAVMDTSVKELDKLDSHFVLGFIYVAEVDEGEQHLTILSPSNQTTLPSHMLLMGGLKYLEV